MAALFIVAALAWSSGVTMTLLAFELSRDPLGRGTMMFGLSSLALAAATLHSILTLS